MHPDRENRACNSLCHGRAFLRGNVRSMGTGYALGSFQNVCVRTLERRRKRSEGAAGERAHHLKGTSIVKSPRLSSSLILLGLLTVGCSKLPTSPDVSGVDPAVEAMGSRRSTVGPSGPGRPETIDGRDGGTVLAGSVRLWIPENAFNGWAKIKMTVTEDAGLSCDLKVTPASLDVLRPVLLTFNVSHLDESAMGVTPLQTLGVYRYDDTQQRWMQVPATFDKVNREITAEMSEFARYKVDKVNVELDWE